MAVKFFYRATRRQDDEGHHLDLEVPNALMPGLAFTAHSVHPCSLLSLSWRTSSPYAGPF